MVNKMKKMFLIFIAVIMFMVPALPVFAEEEQEEKKQNITTSDVINDLIEMDGNFYNSLMIGALKNLTLDDFKSSGVKIISVMEYSYSTIADLSKDFNLYFYVWNPSSLNINWKSSRNSVNIAIGNDNGKGVGYENMALEFVDEANDGDYKWTDEGETHTGNFKGQFYKLRLKNPQAIYDKVRLTPDMRCYCIGGIQLDYNGSIKDWKVGGTYKFSGYSKGCDGNEQSTLSRTVEELETLELNVKQSYYRTGLSSLGDGHQWNINSVYFSVPNDVINKYGELQRIKAEWIEFKTTPMLVSVNSESSVAIAPWIGENYMYKSNEDDRPKFYLYGIQNSFYLGNGNGKEYYHYFYTYNTKMSGADYSDYNTTRINWFFDVSQDYKNVDSDKITPGDVVVKREKILAMLSNPRITKWVQNEGYKYIKDNDGNFIMTSKGSVALPEEMFLKNLDAHREEEGFKAGVKTVFEFDANDEGQRYNYGSFKDKYLSGNAFVDWFRKRYFGIGKDTVIDEKLTDVNPIMVVDMAGESVTAEDYFIGKQDADDFVSYYKNAKALNRTVVVLHFAVTDYFAKWISYDDGVFGTFRYDNRVFASQQTMFFNFDIISLTFAKDGVLTEIPTVADPLDIFGDVTSPLTPKSDGFLNTFFEWLKKVLAVALAVILIIILLPLLGPILSLLIKAVVFVITLPFKLLSEVKRARENEEERKDKDNKK